MTPHLRWECGDRTEPTLVLSQLDRLDRGLPRKELGSVWAGRVLLAVAMLVYGVIGAGVWWLL